jgi:hypothetical protein
MSDYIRKQEAIDRLSEVLSSEAEFEKAKQVIIEAPTLDETEIIRKPFERVVERLEEKSNDIAIQYKHNYEQGFDDGICESIEVIKEEGGLNE